MFISVAKTIVIRDGRKSDNYRENNQENKQKNNKAKRIKSDNLT